jgi:transposase
MPRSYRTYIPEQTLLMPPSLRDWLAEDHLSYFISDAVDAMDLSAFERRYGTDGPGNQAHDPRMMVKVMIYGYATGVFSSRKIAAKLTEDVAFRMLGAENFPAHRTISDFRKLHLEEFGNLFVQVVMMAREAGLVKMGTVAVDGTKIRANASKRKAMSYERMKKQETELGEQIRDLLNRAAATDEDEDQRYGADRRGDELPEGLSTRKKRLATIQAAMKRLEERQEKADQEAGRKSGDHKPRSGKKGHPFKRPMGEPKPTEQDNFTDPESRIMKTSTDGYQQCYNAQVVVDSETRIIVATTLSNNASDVGQLEPALDALSDNLGEQPVRVLADAGYRSESNLGMLEQRQIDGYVAMGREKDLADAALPPKDTAFGRMVRKMKAKPGRDRYRARKHIGEPPFGWIKAVLGFRQFSLRGLNQVTREWDLVALAVNLRRMNGKIEWA